MDTCFHFFPSKNINIEPQLTVKMNYSLSFFWFRETEVGRGKIKGVNIQYIYTFVSAALELT